MKTIILIFLFAFLTMFASGQEEYVKSNSHDSIYSESTLVSGYYLIVDQSDIKRKSEITGEIINLFPSPVLTINNISSMEIIGKEIELYVGPSRPDGHNPILYELKFDFDSEGTCAWAIAIVNESNPYRRIAFVLNNKIIQVQIFDIKVKACITGTEWDKSDKLEVIKKEIEAEKSN